jgi:two-component system nitrogen regulation response regulator NtrX
VRELRNQIERMVIMSQGRTITIKDVSEEIRRGGAAVNLAESSDEPADQGSATFEGMPIQEAKKLLEETLIKNTLDRNGWNVTRAAEELGLERTNLHKKIKAYGLAKDGQ